MGQTITIILLVGAFLVKLFFFVRTGRKRFFVFLRSFTHWYGIYDKHDAENEAIEEYMDISNYINLAFWFGILLFINFFIFKSSDEIQSDEIQVPDVVQPATPAK